ncbi:MAG: thiamine phosphate synthase [Gammaproteobacteria bacterium]|nr:thiamine phosphate synthase [Gammaproteobacteria bacterium]
MTIAPGPSRGLDPGGAQPGCVRQRVHGLYVIADPACLGARPLGTAVEQALRGGARIVQYRDKDADARERYRRAAELARLCNRHAVPFIVNDDPRLASDVGAQGVHLGRDDGEAAYARAILGPDAIIGISCYNEFERAMRAVDAGADYVAFGSVFPSRTKPRAVRASHDLLRRARSELGVAVVAIGGIKPENGATLIEAGADALAVIAGVFGEADVCAAASAYARLFPGWRREPVSGSP